MVKPMTAVAISAGAESGLRMGEPVGRGSMLLYPLRIELVPGAEPIERLGKSKDDYGTVWIESDNPKVTRMRVALKFALEGR